MGPTHLNDDLIMLDPIVQLVVQCPEFKDTGLQNAENVVLPLRGGSNVFGEYTPTKGTNT